ncbi:hypothetical protein C1752_11510 [Acaryochloris thomasi RCC1774]|uniref:Uncharacterized protein n=1 Tax=Acaryochloris thomasi RCC1774 TaxID=1764569 RepID=A0A2W1J8M7_9CYAN|nr:hypothetical protein [Acaryochloris thomasi]PZD70508.1 hypothetical protein C1752_11510 [Acaryochloris thomasi RCC1774]
MVNQLIVPVDEPTIDFTLNEAYSAFSGDPQHSIPLPVWLLENPASPLSFPGQIYLREHDYLHILLDRGISAEDEAFIVGFTMGNDPDTNEQHVHAFKFAARLLYPKPYRFTPAHLMLFDWGFRFGRRTMVKCLNKLDYSEYLSCRVTQLREEFGIDIHAIQHLLGIANSRPWLTAVIAPE